MMSPQLRFPGHFPGSGFTRALGRVSRCLLLTAALALIQPDAADAQQIDKRVALPGSVNAVVAQDAPATSLQAQVVRPALTAAETATPMKINLVLTMRAQDEMRRRVAAGEIITPAEMAAKYLPSATDFETVAAWLQSQGLAVSPAGASHAVVFASGTPAQIAAAFQTSFARVKFQAQEYTAAVAPPSLPAAIAPRVIHVQGLQPYLHPHKHASTLPRNGQVPYLVGDILAAYDGSNGLTGAGQEIGIVIDGPPTSSDLTSFWAANGVPQSLNNISTVDLSDGTLPTPSGEETLDVSWSSGIASGAQVVVYAAGSLDNVDAAFARIIDDLQSGARPNLHQISLSFGGAEQTETSPAYLASSSQIFATIAGYGVSIFVSSGDEGAYGDRTRVVQTEYPASDPSVTSVGGTSLFVNPSTGAPTSETAWSLNRMVNPYDSSGGGVSSYFARPAWQNGTGVPTGTMRLVPDVSLTGDPDTGCYVVLNGQVVIYGGTSWSAPMWAGLCAQINQARAAAGLQPLGLANPSFYSRLLTNNFRDITVGNNGAYTCQVGYDLVTGIGVPDFSVLIQSLASATVTTPVINSNPLASGQVGSAFSYQITATNTPTSFSASGLPAGLTVDTTSGLISGTPTAAGTFTVTLGATNAAGQASATLTLTVAAQTAILPTITGFTPTRGPVGTTVTITGTGFAPPATVSFNGVNASISFTATQIQATVPAGATSGPITVITPDGSVTSAASFTVTTGTRPTPPTPVSNPPVITSALSASGTLGIPFLYQITATNTPTAFSASRLPAGLSLDTATGLISGTPTAAGTFTVILGAANADGTAAATLTLNIDLPLPVITSTLTASGTVGAVFGYQIAATNLASTFSASNLPSGLTIDGFSGLIAGRPTEAGTFAVGLSAHNDTGTTTATLVMSVAVAPPQVSVTATVTPVAPDGGVVGEFTLVRTGDLTQPLTVTYKVGGTGAPGGDYKALKGYRLFKVGKSTVKVKVLPLGSDLGGTGKRTVKMTLLPPHDSSYAVGTGATAKVKIVSGQ